ncbi:MAG TPA: cytochrome c maturation protein CcmE [Candidatus Polarisedimenticolia bacterium]|nr:cytochrome c maturation protein CcmE [Candidatus Polarisedimenticolia bacterium]
MPRKRLQLIVGGIIILGGIGGLIVYSFNQSLVYDHSVAEFLASRSLQSTNCRIYGKVKADSVVQASDGIGVSFEVTDGAQSIPVEYGREVPDTFKENGDVVVEGRLDSQGVFRAHNLLAKCPSKYEEEGVEHPGESQAGAAGYPATGS